jgi:hypothetical protein
MSRIVLISCGSKKLDRAAKVKDLYVSPLFKKALAYAHTLNPDKIFVLSAKYHLLPLDQIINPYDLTLNGMSTQGIKSWACNVAEKLKEEANLDKDEFIFLAGANYRRFLVPGIKRYKVPMEGLGIGKQLKFLTDRLK